MESKFVEADGVRMRWEETGEGLPVVFVHGIPTSPRLWRHVMPRVKGRALAWEMVGYGASITGSLPFGILSLTTPVERLTTPGGELSRSKLLADAGLLRNRTDLIVQAALDGVPGLAAPSEREHRPVLSVFEGEGQAAVEGEGEDEATYDTRCGL